MPRDLETATPAVSVICGSNDTIYDFMAFPSPTRCWVLAKLGCYQASLDAGPLHVNPPTLAMSDSHGKNPNVAPTGTDVDSLRMKATLDAELCCLVSPDSHPVFGRFEVPEKKVMSLVSDAGVPVVCVSQTMFSPLSDSSKNCGLPFVSHPVTAPVPQFIFGTLGGPSRSISIHAGTHNPDYCYDDEVTEQNLADCSDQPFEIQIGDSEELWDRISIERDDMACKIIDFKNRYNEFVRPLLVSRCLITPKDLSHHSTVFLHRQTFQTANHNPSYVSCFDVMAHEHGMTDDAWNMFLDHLVKKKVYVIENWNLSISKIQILMYDHGLVGPQDDTETDFCKGECDASYETGLASLAFIIWRGDKIIYSEIFKNASCKSATEAELYAAFALLSKAKELGIQKMLLCSDCVTICDVLSGQHCIQNVEAKSPEDYDQNIKASSPPKGYDQLVLYLMLRSMKRHFKNLISMWKPRELMVFADDLAKANEVVVGDPHFPGQAMQKWSYHLKGLSLFRIEWTEYTKKKVAKFGKIYLDESHGRSTDLLFHIKVEDQFKFDCLSGIIQAFGTINLSLFVNNIASKIKKYPGFREELKRFVRFNSENRFGICSGFAYPLDEAAHKNLVIVFDAAIARELYYKDNACHIIFVTSEEQNLINEVKIPELTALSLVHFNGVRYPLNDTNRKDEGAKPSKKGVE